MHTLLTLWSLFITLMRMFFCKGHITWRWWCHFHLLLSLTKIVVSLHLYQCYLICCPCTLCLSYPGPCHSLLFKIFRIGFNNCLKFLFTGRCHFCFWLHLLVWRPELPNWAETSSCWEKGEPNHFWRVSQFWNSFRWRSASKLYGWRYVRVEICTLCYSSFLELRHLYCALACS